MTEQQYTLRDVQMNNGKNGAPIWIIIKDVVYDVTNYLEEVNKKILIHR